MSTKKRILLISFFSIFAFSLIVVINWFNKGAMFAGGEEGLPLYNPLKYLYLVSNVWHDGNGGYPVVLLLPRIPYAFVLVILQKLNFSDFILQAFSFFVLIFTGCFSIFILIIEVLESYFKKNESFLIAMLASGFYLLNPYSMSQVWSRGVYAQFFMFALIPLFLLLYIKFLKTKNILYADGMILSSFIFSAAYVVVTNALIVWLPIFFYFFYYVLVINRSRKEFFYTLSLTLSLLIVWILTNFWWIAPTLVAGQTAYSRFLSDADNVATLIGSSRMYFRPEHVIRLLQGFIFFLANTYGSIYSTFGFQILTWSIPIISAASLFYIKRLKILYYFLALFALGYFVSVGANPPFGDVFVWFFKQIPFLQAFRNPYEKAGIILMFAYTPLFSIGMVWISKKLTKSIIPAILVGFIICGILSWPLLSGKFTPSWVKVPNYYKEADQWLASQEGDFKIIQMPLINGDGIKYNWEYPYQGIEPGEYLFTRSSIGRNIAFNKIYYNILLERFGLFVPLVSGPDPDVSQSEFRSKYFWEELSKLNIKYIVLHNDWDKSFMGGNSNRTIDLLSSEKNIKKVKEFGDLSIYEVSLPKNVAQVYSPTEKIKFTKINSSLYKIEAIDISKSYDLYLLEMYDPEWKVAIDGKEIDGHSRVFSYANKWSIDKLGTYDFILKYKPQDYVRIGWRITGLFFLFLFSLSLVIILRKRGK